jgi:hypothetical protein
VLDAGTVEQAVDKARQPPGLAADPAASAVEGGATPLRAASAADKPIVA